MEGRRKFPHQMIAISDLTQRHLWCLDWMLDQRMEGLEIVAWLRVARFSDDCTKKTSSFQASPGNRPSPCPGSRVLHALLPLEQPPEIGLAVLPSQNMLRQIGWSTTSHSQTSFPPPENAESSSNFLVLHDWNVRLSHLVSIESGLVWGGTGYSPGSRWDGWIASALFAKDIQY